MKTPNLKILDQSTNWSQRKLSEKRVRVRTTVATLDAAEIVGNFAIKTFRRAGYEVATGAITPNPNKREEIQVEIVFRPKGAAC